MHGESAFINLTFDDRYLPEDFSVHVRTFQLFMKRLRKALKTDRIRFFACGEYGDENLRPHYHALIFGCGFPDKRYFKTTPRGDRLYTSSFLESVWQKGHCPIGDVTFESAGYVARYNMKKQTGDDASAHYLRQHPLTRLWHFVEPEFLVMSRRPGIGQGWLEKYRSDVYPHDQVVIGGGQGRGVCAPPRYYDNQLPELELEALKRLRKKRGLKFKEHQRPDRLRARAAVRDARISQLKRQL